MDVKSKLKKLFSKRVLIGFILGGIVGFLYYYFFGCQSGSCSITSNPVNSVLFGIIIGVVIAY
ncbi:MAG: hypothetical protein DRJ01_00145 [Bacteroidetes bacterium]|nr:MAG: hypothetical protein DRJ01_00145 [Bacteroidota bacterium]